MRFVEEMLTTATWAAVVGAAVIDTIGCWTGVVAGFVDTAILPDVPVHPAIRIIAMQTIKKEKIVIFLISFWLYFNTLFIAF
jgi:hypothetical protein